MTERIFNFSAGPAVLPLPVLEETQRNLLSLPGVGMSVLEISHRSKAFDEIILGAEADMRKLASIPDNYRMLFLQGGASLQFSMVPMNLLTAGSSADYILTGIWSKKALKEAKRVGRTNVAATTEPENFARIPRQDELNLDPEAAYVHFTTNNTIHGTEWKQEPQTGDVPLVGDASSDIFSHPIERIEVRADLRGRAEEPRAGGRDARHHTRRFAGAQPREPAYDAQLQHACSGEVAFQHAARLCDLRHAAGVEMAARSRRA